MLSTETPTFPSIPFGAEESNGNCGLLAKVVTLNVISCLSYFATEPAFEMLDIAILDEITSGEDIGVATGAVAAHVLVIVKIKEINIMSLYAFM
jgi:hypothetical protein